MRWGWIENKSALADCILAPHRERANPLLINFAYHLPPPSPPVSPYSRLSLARICPLYMINEHVMSLRIYEQVGKQQPYHFSIYFLLRNETQSNVHCAVFTTCDQGDNLSLSDTPMNQVPRMRDREVSWERVMKVCAVSEGEIRSSVSPIRTLSTPVGRQESVLHEETALVTRECGKRRERAENQSRTKT